MLGAKVLATARGAAKCARARDLGADEAVDTAAQDFVAEARRWTGKRGVDVVVDHVGADTFDRSIRCLVKGGRYVTCGATSGYEMKTDFRYVYFKSLSILGSTMGGEPRAGRGPRPRGRRTPATGRGSHPCPRAGRRGAPAPGVARGLRQGRPCRLNRRRSTGRGFPGRRADLPPARPRAVEPGGQGRR